MFCGEQATLSSVQLTLLVYTSFVWFTHYLAAVRETRHFHILNRQDDNIKLKAAISDLTVDFWDVTSYKGTRFKHSGYLNVFLKPQTYISFYRKSFHARQTFKGKFKITDHYILQIQGTNKTSMMFLCFKINCIFKTFPKINKVRNC